MSPDLVPTLILSLLLLFSGGEQHTQILSGGEHRIATTPGAVVVADGEVTVPPGVVVAGPLHVIGGEVTVEGTVRGGVTVLGGRLTLAPTARVTGAVRHYGGDVDVAAEADGHVAAAEIAGVRTDPLAHAATTAAGALALAGAGGLVTRRRPRTLGTVGRAVTQHPVICLTVGTLVSATGISLLVFMAFTLVLLPVSILGLVAGVLLVAHGVLALGHLVGRRLPVRRAAPATALGVLAVIGAIQVLELVPVVGDVVVLALLLAGLGAVLLTYLGLRTFEPVPLAMWAPQANRDQPDRVP